MNLLDVYDLTVKYGGHEACSNVGFSVHEGDWFMLVGPNGAGKTTVINAVSQVVPYGGEVLFKGRPVKRLKSAERAKCIGVLSQTYSAAYPFTVEEIVRLGRYPYSRDAFRSMGYEDREKIREAVETTGLESLLKQPITKLSGGELQRTFLAQVFAQNPKLLILDEPANHLDLVYQKQIFEQVENWLRKPGRAVISVVHDLSIAKAYGTKALLMENGRVVARGSASGVLTPEMLDSVYSIDISKWMKKLLSQWK